MSLAKEEGTEEVEIELKGDKILELALIAHERDITLNELINNILKDYLSLVDNKE